MHILRLPSGRFVNLALVTDALTTTDTILLRWAVATGGTKTEDGDWDVDSHSALFRDADAQAIIDRLDQLSQQAAGEAARPGWRA